MGNSDSAFRKHPAAVRALTVCGLAASVVGLGAAAWAAEAPAGGSTDPLSSSLGGLGGVSSVFGGGLPVNSLPVVGGLLGSGS
ncbi:MAG TPA: hypothetical protein VGM10_24830 [Actinocrinis sp.]|jgi:hypothetical protein